MNNKIKTLLFAIAITLSVTSCLEQVPLDNDTPGPPQSLANMQSSFVNATDGLTPMEMKKDEWALYRIQAKLYTGEFQGLGYKAAQVLDSTDGTITVEDKNYDTRNMSIAITDYKEPVNGGEAEVEVQKQWDCKFVKPPYYLWYGDCPLPPEQNFWVYQGISEPATPIFFSLARYSKKEKLPQVLIDENRCYGFENCEITVNYLEYDIFGKDAAGKNKRVHYIASFSGELPYLASNLKTCYTTLIELNGEEHPAEVCQELVNFNPGTGFIFGKKPSEL
jgi:hypothetical protein